MNVKHGNYSLDKLEVLNMKRILLFCYLVLILCQATAFAKEVIIPKEELCIGGVNLDCTLGYVKEIYGEPKEVIRKEEGRSGTKMGRTCYITYVYSDTFKVTGKKGEREPGGEDDARVVAVFIKDNSLSTPSGFTVGMPYAAVAEMFGKGWKHTRQGITWYGYASDMSGIRAINFHVDDAETVTAITVYSQH